MPLMFVCSEMVEYYWHLIMQNHHIKWSTRAKWQLELIDWWFDWPKLGIREHFFTNPFLSIVYLSFDCHSHFRFLTPNRISWHAWCSILASWWTQAFSSGNAFACAAVEASRVLVDPWAGAAAGLTVSWRCGQWRTPCGLLRAVCDQLTTELRARQR